MTQKLSSKLFTYLNAFVGILLLCIVLYKSIENNMQKSYISSSINQEAKESKLILSDSNKIMKQHLRLKKSIDSHLSHTVTFIDASIIQLIMKIPQIKKLIFNILDDDSNKEVNQAEFSIPAHEIFQNQKDQDFIQAFSQDAFNQVNNGQSYNFKQFNSFFDSFMLRILSSQDPPFIHTPNFQKEEIRGLILFLANQRKNWDRCLITLFHILDADNNRFVYKEEVQSFLQNINQETWEKSKPYVEKIWKYMQATGTANDNRTDVGSLVAFGELVRPYMPEILDKYME